MLDEIDWTAPWFEPWREVGAGVAAQVRPGEALHDALNRCSSEVMRFVPAHSLPDDAAYEQFIFDTGQCPTRASLHDFFNGLAWLGMPKAKRQCNRIQAAQIAAQGVRGERGAVRDAVTLFDENGAVLSAPPPLWDALRQRDWPRLFVQLRPLWQDAQLLVFGHALLEKLVHPRKNLTAHVLDVAAPATSIAQLDGWLASELTNSRLARKPFTPLPLMGIPGWHPENQDFSFYDDPLVFRPARRPAP
jgi:hypothetical protein